MLYCTARTTYWKALVAAALLVLGCATLRATDTFPEDVRLDADTLGLNYRYTGFPLRLSFKINNNNVLPTDRFFVNFSVFSMDGATKYIDSTIADTLDLPPFTRRDYTLRNIWTPPAAGQYRLSLNVDYRDDINRSNDTVSTTIDVRPGAVSIREILHRRFSQQFGSGTDDTLLARGFMFPTPLPVGTTVRSADTTAAGAIRIEQEQWLGYFDANIYSRDIRHEGIVLIDGADTNTITPFPLFRPILSSPMQFRLNNTSVVYNPTPLPFGGDTMSLHFPAASPFSGGSSGAILVSGTGWTSFDQNGFNGNAGRMATELLLDLLGPRVPFPHIHPLLHPTLPVLNSSLEGLKNRYDTLTFMYSGHTDTLGRALLADTAYIDHRSLLNGLFSLGAKNVNVVLDHDYSGAAIGTVLDIAAASDQYRALDITVITSTTSGKATRDIVIPGEDYTAISEFILALTQSMGHPGADNNGDTTVSFAEAYTRVRRINPILQTGERMDTTMQPRLFVQRNAHAVSTQTLRFHDADLFITPQADIPSNPRFTVQMHTTPFGTQPADTTVVAISTGRRWNLDIEPTVPFTVDLQFHLRQEYDTLAAVPGIPGVVRREPGAIWTAHYPVVWDAANRVLTAKNVDRFSEWAIAVVKEPAPASSVPEHHSLFAISDIRPNPFSRATTIRFECKKPGAVDIAIVDALGNRIQTLASGFYQPGVYDIVFDAAACSNGMYFCRLHADGITQTRALLHSR